MSGRALQRWRLLVLLWLPVSLSAPAKAEEPSAGEVLVARRLFQSATADEELGRWEPALKTLREVETIKVTPGVLFHIAVCEQNLRRYVEALNDLGRAEELAQVKADDSVLALVPARRQDIDAMVARLKLEFIGSSEDAEVRVDGQRVLKTTLKLDIPLDPHEHTIEVLRPDKPTLMRTVSLPPGSHRTEQFDLTVVAPALSAEHAEAELPVVDRHDPNLNKRVVTYSAYGLAVAGAAVGVYFVVDAGASQRAVKRARSDVDAAAQDLGTPITPGSECFDSFAHAELNQACVELRRATDARDRSRTLALWSFAVAGAGALGGTAVLLFWPEAEQKLSLRLTPTVGGALLSGQF